MNAPGADHTTHGANGRGPVAVVKDYLAALARGDQDVAGNAFASNLTYVASGRSRLAGVTHGLDAAGRWFGAMSHLSNGTYRLLEEIDWLSTDEHALLIARESAAIGGRSREWIRSVLFTVVDEGIERVQLLEDDQLAYDRWVGEDPSRDGAVEPDEPYPLADTPDVLGAVDDARVLAILRYQQDVAAGRLDEARRIFSDDVVYTVPGRSLLAGEYRGPDAVMGYLGTLFALTEGRYVISRMLWLASPDRVGLFTRNHAERGGRVLSWDELIVFRFVDGRKKAISHFSGNQYGVDELFAP